MLAPFLIGAGLAGETMIGTIALLGFSLNVTKTIVFGMSPLLTHELMVTWVYWSVSVPCREPTWDVGW